MRIILHIDMDAFFAAVEERENPQFSHKPVVVGADPQGGSGRGVVSTANYAARRYGIRSAMPISRAWRLAEDARRRGELATIFVTPNFHAYEDASERIMAIIAPLGDRFEQASIDEAYVDVSSAGSFAKARVLAERIKRAIRENERLTASIGVGPNKLVAKIASDFKKPDGLTVVEPDGVLEFLAPLAIRALPGIGPKTETELAKRGVRTIGDLHNISRTVLVEAFGKWGDGLWRHARGQSEDPVSNDGEPKSVGEQETFERDTLAASFILERMRDLGAAVVRRLHNEGFATFRTVVITVRFADFATATRSHTSRTPLTSADDLYAESLRMLLPFLDARENPRRKAIRLIGVRVEKLARAQSRADRVY
ncbi:DNA polymerase IV [Candidatus Parcubacteria bacterium]|nr:MAG: DNA polymerase IV [Candidatus Parcubacteria bacterium]